MSKILGQIAACSPSQKPDSYIYSITPTTSNGLAAITSADELLLLDRENPQSSPALFFSNVPEGVTCMVAGDMEGASVICSGRDGIVATFDVRTQKRISHFKQDNPIIALACRGQEIATGTELANHQAIVSVWDRRQNRLRWQNAENNDDITDLQFHPTKQNRLLSGGVDGLVSIFDTSIADPEESLLQVVNHGPIHKAGFLDETTIYALSSDENLSLHPVSTDDDVEDPEPVVFGDLREVLGGEYAIGISPIGLLGYLAVGNHSSNPRIQLHNIQDGKLRPTPDITITGAHGEEVIRSLFADTESGTVFTAGEDGQIRAFKPSENQDPKSAAPKSKKHQRKDSIDARYRPY